MHCKLVNEGRKRYVDLKATEKILTLCFKMLLLLSDLYMIKELLELTGSPVFCTPYSISVANKTPFNLLMFV